MSNTSIVLAEDEGGEKAATERDVLECRLGAGANERPAGDDLIAALLAG